MSADKYWDQYYTENTYRTGKEPSPFLSSMMHRLQRGKVLDIGMGEGANAVFLAKQGFNVKGFDISTIAVERAQNLAKEQNVSIDANRADLDLYLMGLLEYDSIIMMNFKPVLTRYYSEIIRALKQGGTLLVEAPSMEEIRDLIPTEEAYRNYFFGSNELFHHIKGLRILFYQEGLVYGKHMIQCLALKPLDKDAVKYGLFDMHSKQKDTGPSHQLKLAESFFKKKD